MYSSFESYVLALRRHLMHSASEIQRPYASKITESLQVFLRLRSSTPVPTNQIRLVQLWLRVAEWSYGLQDPGKIDARSPDGWGKSFLQQISTKAKIDP